MLILNSCSSKKRRGLDKVGKRGYDRGDVTLHHYDVNVSEKGERVMNTPLQQRIIGNLQQLASLQRAEASEVVEFLRFRQRVVRPAPDMIDVLGGT